MRSASARVLPWTGCAGAFLGGFALGVIGRWLVGRWRSRAASRRALTTVETARALAPSRESLLQAAVGPVPSATSLRLALLVAAIAIVVAAALMAGARAYRDSERRHAIDVATGGVGGRAIPIMRANGCAACHTIAGVPGARGLVGPRLDATLSSRIYLAGVLPNNTENMVRWLRSARAIAPHTAMPSTGISEQEARDVVAYLYALR